MKIKIYQIDRDKDNGSLSFLNYENTVKRTRGKIRSEIYHKVFDGDVECSGLEDVYAMFNETRRLSTPTSLKKVFTSVIASASKRLILSRKKMSKSLLNHKLKEMR